MESSDVKLPALKELQSPALLELHNKMNEVHSMLSALMSGLSAQSSVLNELRSVVIDKNDKNDKNEKNETDKDAFRLSNTTNTSELQLHLDALAAPSDEPPVLAVIPAVVPGILEEMWEKTLPSSAKVPSNRSATSLKSPQPRPSSGAQSPGQRANSKNKSASIFSAQSSRGRVGSKRAAMSMDDVEHHTMQLVTDRRFSGHSGHRTPHLSPGMSLSMQGSQVDPVAEDGEDGDGDASASFTASRSAPPSRSATQQAEQAAQSDQEPQRTLRTSPSRFVGAGEGQRVLQMCRRMSLDDLRLNHDAIIATTQRTDTNTRPAITSASQDSHSTSFPRFAKLWLAFVGLLDFPHSCGPFSRPGCALFISSLLLVILVASVISLTSAGVSDPYISATTLCYLLGVLAAAWRLRWSGVQDLLMRDNGGLEEYAMKSGFLEEWRRTSRQRFKEVLCFLLVMLCCRWLADTSNRIWELETRERPEISGCFSVAAIVFSAMMYIQLHIVAGMEHAIDSFSINFYKDMDIEVALSDWNMVQATLRQVSTKLSPSMLLLGSSCGASLLLLVQLTVLTDDASTPGLKSGLPFLAFTSWLFPPVLLFLYTMMRAAGVTEKASRVAPLVNSWNFENDDEDNPAWMDLGRQYIVQYMIQSEAGFYLQGMRLHRFQVTKLSYYFAAFIFALFSRSWA